MSRRELHPLGDGNEDLRVNRSELRMQPHDDLVAAEGEHRRGRLRLEGHQRSNVRELRAEVLQHLLRRLGRTTGTMDDEIELVLVDVVTDLHETVNVPRLHRMDSVRLASRSKPAARVDDDGSTGQLMEAADVLVSDSVEVGTLVAALMLAALHLAEDLSPARHGPISYASTGVWGTSTGPFVETAAPTVALPATVAR